MQASKGLGGSRGHMREGSRANMNYPLGYQVNPPDLVNSVSLTRLTLDKQLNVAGEESFWGLAIRVS